MGGTLAAQVPTHGGMRICWWWLAHSTACLCAPRRRGKISAAVLLLPRHNIAADQHASILYSLGQTLYKSFNCQLRSIAVLKIHLQGWLQERATSRMVPS